MGFFGVLKHMNDVIKYNREVLGQKKTARQRHKEGIKNQRYQQGNEDLVYLKERVDKALERNPGRERFELGITMFLTFLLVGGALWTIFNVSFSIKAEQPYVNKEDLFKTMTEHLEDGSQKVIERFPSGPIAAESRLVDGQRSQYSVSYYPSGELFRSAVYSEGILIEDTYYYKDGSSIPGFHFQPDDNVHRIKLLRANPDRVIRFDYYNGKIIEGTYSETPD